MSPSLSLAYEVDNRCGAQTARRRVGASLIEMLIVVTVVAILLALAVFVYRDARDRATLAAANGFASEVLKSAVGSLALGADPPTIGAPDCRGGYASGLFEVDPPPGAIDSCVVTALADFVEVRVESRGVLIVLP